MPKSQRHPDKLVKECTPGVLVNQVQTPCHLMQSRPDLLFPSHPKSFLFKRQTGLGRQHMLTQLDRPFFGRAVCPLACCARTLASHDLPADEQLLLPEDKHQLLAFSHFQQSLTAILAPGNFGRDCLVLVLLKPWFWVRHRCSIYLKRLNIASAQS